ncbi:disulfide bond formation protein DsbA [Massilia eurypsychrophila]|jgi:protein-disulfide isomerase|uniref:Disulfide bond formation protein DsbA n=1 Tax=Massilia eurypsychrophila TaxID=1485217 RepID=A0A2G8TFI3_9BURK|nr:DsbA family protein [Massilia eurypsychrophila]PIL44796.1 disulfide bond formation protein DsbA [Massilia eurypsychrophila]
MSPIVSIHPDDHMTGSRDAAIVLVEYGDYQCPYSRRAHAGVKDLQRRLGDQLCFVYRHFPLTGKHPYAEMSAETAEAAGDQGMFWQMHDALFELQPQFGPGLIAELAERLGLSVEALCDDVLTRRFQARVEQIAAGGTHIGVEETPTFFINGERHAGDSDELSLVSAIMRFVA